MLAHPLGADVFRALDGFLHARHAQLGVHKGLGDVFGLAVVQCLVPHDLRQRLQALFFGHGCPRLALGIVWQIQIFEQGERLRGQDLRFQFGREFSLLGDRFEDGCATFFHQSAEVQGVSHGAELLFIESAGHFDAVSGKEGDGGAFIQQGGDGLYLFRAELELGRNGGNDLCFGHAQR